MSLPVLDLPVSLKPRLSQGHPWVYRTHVPDDPHLASGAWVRVRCGSWAAVGLWDAASPIAVRLFARQAVPDADWVADRVAEAWAVREPVRAGATTGYRWLYGESDGLPGVVVDLYGEFAVIQTYAASLASLVPWVADALHAHTRLRGILWRPAGSESVGTEPLWGRRPPADLTIEEHGLLFYANLLAGQKTGLFFDQRDNRRTLATWCRNQAMLDCFCYTGGFAMHALCGGAASIMACDSSSAAIEAAQRNLALNGFNPDGHTFHIGDCFGLLQRLAEEGRQFGVVVLDPPSLARDRQSRHAAERAYVRLNRLALRCVEPGGILASASCTSQVGPSEFHQALAEAARSENRRLLILHDAGQPVDHPVAAHFPEGRYLKFVIGRVVLPA